MKVKLLADGRDGKAGETVEVSPERSAFLLSIEAAVTVNAGEQAEEPVKEAERNAEKKTAAKKTPAKKK